MLLNEGSIDEATIHHRDKVDAMFRNDADASRSAVPTSVMPTLSNNADLSFGAPVIFGLGFSIHHQGLPNGESKNTGSCAGLFNSYC